MHELSVALSLLDGVTEAAKREGAGRVSAVHVRIGALSGIAPDALAFSWDIAVASTVADGSRLEIEFVPLAVFCERCASEQFPLPGTGLLCPSCETPAPRIVRGRELLLTAMEIAS